MNSNVTASTPISLIEEVYAGFAARSDLARDRLGRGLTLAEKILWRHLADPGSGTPERGRTPPRRWPCSSS
jgi:hypothetical protein